MSYRDSGDEWRQRKNRRRSRCPASAVVDLFRLLLLLLRDAIHFVVGTAANHRLQDLRAEKEKKKKKKKIRLARGLPVAAAAAAVYRARVYNAVPPNANRILSAGRNIIKRNLLLFLLVVLFGVMKSRQGRPWRANLLAMARLEPVVVYLRPYQEVGAAEWAAMNPEGGKPT